MQGYSLFKYEGNVTASDDSAQNSNTLPSLLIPFSFPIVYVPFLSTICYKKLLPSD